MDAVGIQIACVGRRLSGRRRFVKVEPLWERFGKENFRFDGVPELCPEFFEAGRFCRLRFFLGFEACLLFLPLRPALLADRLGAAFEGFAVRAAVSLPSVGDLVDPGFIFLLIEAAFSVGTTCHAINLQFL